MRRGGSVRRQQQRRTKREAWRLTIALMVYGIARSLWRVRVKSEVQRSVWGRMAQKCTRVHFAPSVHDWKLQGRT